MSKTKALSARRKRAFLFTAPELGIAEVEGEGFAIQSKNKLVEDVAP
jgi:hypothetical protein